MAEREDAALPVWLGWARLAIGLAQGYALYLITNAHIDPPTPLYAALTVTLLYVPVLVVGGLGALRWPTLIAWTILATLIAAGFAWYDVDRLGGSPRTNYGPQVIYFVAPAFLFIGHHLVAAGDEARRWIAPYERYFDLGWRHGAQLLLAVLFTGAFWAVLYLGASLFDLINVHFLRELIGKSWFSMPASFGVFAAALHLTDLRSGLVHGARALGLILLSWLLPAMTLLAAAFIAALPFTGLEPLWATRAATAILLSAAAALVVLINAAYQDGAHPPGFLRSWSARIAAVLLTPLATLAAYALYQRIGQYGLTPERIYVAAVLIIGVCYAVSYTIGAFQPRWMKMLEIGNVVSAFVTLGVAIALFTPIADPARLSVDNQLARLRAGIVSPDHFDVAFLRFDGARYGQAALRRLRADQSTDAARALGARANTALTLQTRWSANDDLLHPLVITVHPAGAALPPTFSATTAAVEGLCRSGACDAFSIDLTNDGRPDVIVGSTVFWVFSENDKGEWLRVGTFVLSPEQSEAMRAGHARAAPAMMSDLMIDNARVQIQRTDEAPPDLGSVAVIAP